MARCGARQTAHGKSVWETSDKKHQSLFAIAKRNEMKSLKTPLSTEIQYKFSHFLQIKTLQSISLYRIVVEKATSEKRVSCPKNRAQVNASVFRKIKFDFVMSSVNVKARGTYSIHYAHISRMRPEAIVN